MGRGSPPSVPTLAFNPPPPPEWEVVVWGLAALALGLPFFCTPSPPLLLDTTTLPPFLLQGWEREVAARILAEESEKKALRAATKQVCLCV